MNKRNEILDALSKGPVSRYALMNGRKAVFRLTYHKLLAEGLIIENGAGGKGSPIYVGLPGVSFPAPRYVGGVRPADVALLVRSGMSEADAKETVQTAIDSPGDNRAALEFVLIDAHARIEKSDSDWDAVPMPVEKQSGAGRPKKGEPPFFNPLMSIPPEFDGKYRA
jgi:hypothetical protein